MSLRGSYLSHEEGSNGGAIHPLGAAPSPIKGGGGDLLSTSSFPLLLTCPLVDIFLPLLVLYSSTCLGEALLSFSLHHHHHAVVLLEFPRIHYFRCPTGARDGGRRQAVRVTDYGSVASCNVLHHDLEIGK
jgi:hypothetical protein